MRGPPKGSIAHKKLNPAIPKKTNVKADSAQKKQKATKKNSDAPRRPPGPFLVFMEEFRKCYKEKFPDNTSVADVGKAGGQKWRSMTELEKSLYVDKAHKRNADYQKALEAFNKKLNCGGEDANVEKANNTTSEVYDEDEESV